VTATTRARVVGLGSPTGWDWSIEQRVLAGIGAELEVRECRTDADVAAALSAADAVMSHHTVRITGDALAMASQLRAVVVCGTGFDHVDVDAAEVCGIAVANVPDYCTEEVSDHALALLLALNRRLPILSWLVRAGRWDDLGTHPLRRLRGQVLGLYGFGKIARRLAAKAAPLGLRMLAFDPYVARREIASAGVEPAGDLEALLEPSDYVSLHAQLTSENHKIFGARTFGRMKKGSCLVNCSRGELVDEAALYDALSCGHLGGAALDVLEDEPMDAANPLLGLDNVIVTPHAAWWSVESEEELHDKSAHAVVEVLEGRPPPHLVGRATKAFWWLAEKGA
jgi:D-3-phosphoglycerate dehydrogenase / 2-oxoglutarate reductase